MGECTINTAMSEELGDVKILKVTKDGTLGRSTFLVPFFNFFSSLFLVPFKIITVTSLDGNRFQLKSCLLRKVICALAHTLVYGMFLCMVILTVMFSVKNNEPAIVLFFDLTSNFSALAAMAIVINLLWQRQNGFLRVIECTRVQISISFSTWNVCIAVLIYSTLLILFICINIMTWLAVNNENHASVIVALIRGTFSNANFSVLSDGVKDYENNVVDGSQKIFNGVIFGLYLCTSIFYMTIQGTLLTLAMTLRQLGNQFYERISRCRSIDKGIAFYRELKNTSDEIRRVYGNHLMAYYTLSVSYYAEAPHILLGKRGNMERLVYVYFEVSGVVWVVAAEFHHHVRNTMQKWMRYHTSGIMITAEDRLKLLAIHDEISGDPVALASKYFKVTYGHIGSMVGLILTYAIIVCQLYHNKDVLQ